MINLDNELADEYLAECREHLHTMEAGLLAIEQAGSEIDDERINQVFRAVHSVKGGAGFFDLVKIRELAHQTEDVLSLIRSREMVPAPAGIRTLLRATDKLIELIHNPGESNQADITEVAGALALLRPKEGTVAGAGCMSAGERRHSRTRSLRTLLVEDDFASRLLLQTFLSRYGECHIAVNGQEAVDAFRATWECGQRYDLICMDIMMPIMDGCEAVREVRAYERAHGVLSTSGAKIIMTTTVRDVKQVIRCFKELCDAYLMKPIDLAKLLGCMRSYQLVE